MVRESEERSGYIVWIISRLRRQRDVETERAPRGVLVPGLRTCGY